MPKNDIIFGYDDYFNDLFERMSVIMWNTRYSVHTFAFYLNQLYNLRLERREDITLVSSKEPISCSVFSCCDNVDKSAVFLIENKKTPLTSQPREFSYFDKTLLVIAPDAAEKTDAIYNDINRPPSSPADIYSACKEELRTSFIDNGIVESVIFDFSDPDNPVCSWFQPTDYKALSKQRQKFILFHKNHTIDLLVGLDKLLPDFETE